MTSEQVLEVVLRLVGALDQRQAGVLSQSALRHGTRLADPEMAAMLDSGDVKGAADRFLANLDGQR